MSSTLIVCAFATLIAVAVWQYLQIHRLTSRLDSCESDLRVVEVAYKQAVRNVEEDLKTTQQEWTQIYTNVEAGWEKYASKTADNLAAQVLLNNTLPRSRR